MFVFEVDSMFFSMVADRRFGAMRCHRDIPVFHGPSVFLAYLIFFCGGVSLQRTWKFL